VILQGNNGESLFRCEEDHAYFCSILGEGVQRFRHSVHTFCSMTNHVHQAVQAAEAPLKLVYHHDCLKYAKWFNKKYKRKGHLFQSPYKAILVDTDAYLLELIRYIHLNPVRAGMVGRPEDYKWSSYRAYLGEECPDWLTVDWILGMFSQDVREARVRFQEFVCGGIDRPEMLVLEQLLSGESRTIGMNDVIEQVCQIYALREEEIRTSGREQQASEARALCAVIARELKIVKLSDMSRYFGQSRSALSRSSLILLDRALRDRILARKIEEVKLALARKLNNVPGTVST
jgi:REP element-mobilizing transposase RayT